MQRLANKNRVRVQPELTEAKAVAGRPVEHERVRIVRVNKPRRTVRWHVSRDSTRQATTDSQ